MAHICSQMFSVRKRLITELTQKKRKLLEITDLLGVSAVTVRKWKSRFLIFGEKGLLPKKRGHKEFIPKNKTPEEIEEKVCAIAEENFFSGPREIAKILQETENFSLDQSTIFRILRRKKVRYVRGSSSEKKRRRKLYSLDRVGRELQLDVSFPFGYARRECIFTAIDDCSRFVFSRLMPDHTEKSSISFLEKLFLAFPFPIEAIRTDCGQEFSKKFMEFLRERGIEHRKNAPYCPEHNGKVERYHRTMKENVSFPFFAEREEINYLLDRWSSFYNEERPHSGLGMDGMTPVQKICYSFLVSSLKKETKLGQQYIIFHNFAANKECQNPS